MPKLATNTFRLNWRIVSADDLHITRGSIVFGVGVAQASADSAPVSAVDPVEVALTWLGFAALAGLLGSILAAFVLLPPGIPGRSWPAGLSPASVERRRRSLLGVAVISAALGLIAAIATVANEAWQVGGADAGGIGSAFGSLGATGHGLRSMLTIGLLALALVVALGLRRWARVSGDRQESIDASGRVNVRSLRLATVLVGICVAIAVLRALSSHSAGVADNAPVTVLAATVHILAAALWTGGLICLALVAVPSLRGGSQDIRVAGIALRHFGVVAAASLAAVLVTGLLEGGALVASIDALLFANYGQLLLIKVMLACAVAAIGLYNSASLHPAVARSLAVLLRPAAGLLHLSSHFRATEPDTSETDGTASQVDTVERGVAPMHAASGATSDVAPEPRLARRLRRSVVLETVGAIAVLLMAATLGSTAPANGPEWAPAPAPPPQSASGQADDLVVDLTIRPKSARTQFLHGRGLQHAATRTGPRRERAPAAHPTPRQPTGFGLDAPGNTHEQRPVRGFGGHPPGRRVLFDRRLAGGDPGEA